MKPIRSSLLVVALAVPALAQDGDPTTQPPAPAPAPAPTPAPATAPAGGDAAKPAAPAEKKERKVDPAAMKALERHAALVHFPATDGMKELSGKGHLVDQMGTKIGLNPRWSAEKGFDLEVELPEQVKKAAAAQGATEEQAKDSLKQQFTMFLGLNSIFEAPGKNWAHFHVACKQQGDDQVVDLTPFDDEADAESRSYVFGKDGLLKTSSMSPKVDPNDPRSAMMAGAVFESQWTFEKKGERHVLVNRTLSIMGTDVPTSFNYYEGPNGTYFLKDATVSSPQGEQVINFSDYTVDGKLVESTKAATEKPVEKPADKPADTPAPPTPPAPKEGDK